MTSRFLLALIFLLLFKPAFSQEYNYVHYNTQDGLAGSTVYDMCQDKDGFMWFATQNGLSRYDGTHFTNFTVKDGLPDNEVLKVFADSKGRVWIGSLSKEVCFYYKGKIFNKQNTPVFNDSQLQINGFKFCEDIDGNIAISDYHVILEITSDFRIIVLTDLPAFKKIQYSSVYVRQNPYENGFFVVLDANVYKLKDRDLKLFLPWGNFPKNSIGLHFSNGKAVYIKAPSYILGETIVNGVNRYESAVDGAWSVDTINYRLGEHFLTGKRISCTIDDEEGNTWFCCLGEGVFKLPSRQMKTFRFNDFSGIKATQEVFTIATAKNNILAGLSFSKLAMIEGDKVRQVFDFGEEIRRSANALTTNRIYKSFSARDGNIFLGADGFLAKMQGNNMQFGTISSIKSITELGDKHLLVGNHAFAFKVRRDDLTIADTVWRSRCTDAVYFNGSYFIGTMEGLYKIDQKKIVHFLGTLHPNLQRRIVRIVKDDKGNLFVATADKGLIVLTNDKISYVLNDKNGLSSNICRALFVDGRYAWLGTNKGINKIDLRNPLQIVKYSTSDGLPSDIINDLLIQDSIIWVASPNGLTYFNENKIKAISNCNLVLLGLKRNGDKMPDGTVRLPFNENKIAFKYVAISHKSTGGVNYFYKLSGLDSNYHKTDQTELSFLSLPPGIYHFSLYAVNKFGKKSKTIEVSFVVATPFWRTGWFYLAVLIVTSTVTTLLLSRRNKILRSRLEEKNRFQRQLATLEQQALQSQMNPHFIFNCLNSIQQYVLTNDKRKANLYLTGFATLIRQTLSISTRTGIAIEEEVEYLTKYLEMEKMRFGENFHFKVWVDPILLNSNIEVPSLLLQPYVENALRHGIRHKEEGRGQVDVIFSKQDDIMYCRVIDNGVGRKKSAEFKGIRHIEYQSKGMQLTAKRIQLINIINDDQLQYEVIDLYDENNKPRGTEVIVKIPLHSNIIAN